MLTVYHSNQLEMHKEMLVHLLKIQPNPDPFSKEIVLVQSQGMITWLQMQIADSLGISASIDFPYPNTFLRQQYRALFSDLPEEDPFSREQMVWQLMRLLPQHLSQAEFSSLRQYLNEENDQLKRFQLADKIADLFDQYLVFRPWWEEWEKGQCQQTMAELTKDSNLSQANFADMTESVQWQALLWKSLVDDIGSNATHRAKLQDLYFNKLRTLSTDEISHKLPKRLFVFGISSLPPMHLSVLQQLSQYIDVHLFFLSPSQTWWGDKGRIQIERQAVKKGIKNAEDIDDNTLLSLWGNQGRELLTLLSDCEHTIEAYGEPDNETNLLSQLKNSVLNNTDQISFHYQGEQDNSIQFHLCHSAMREIEVLHDQLLTLFATDPDLLPKDIIVMSTDIDRYAPYINAVFGRYSDKDKRYIPFAVSDQKETVINPVFAGFLALLKMSGAKSSAEEILDLLDIQAIQEKFSLDEEQLHTLRVWIKDANVRAGWKIEESDWQNYNSWENGLNRLLLGSALGEQDGIWQNTVAYSQSYGLQSELVGKLADFIRHIEKWNQFVQQPHSISEWNQALNNLLADLFAENETSSKALTQLAEYIDVITNQIITSNFEEEICAEIIFRLFESCLSEQLNQMNFLTGKVNFCTLLPMRAIPFKVVCLLGVNESEFPRQQNRNSFDLMQYKPHFGDRSRRNDDHYMFLEALLAAQDVFYISYIGRNVKNNKEKLPSLLVSQLKDYILGLLPDNAQKEAFIENQCVSHSMSILNPDNFIGKNASFNREWLVLVQHKSSEFDDFIQNEMIDSAILNAENKIALDDLIAFVSEPVKFFFNRNLGIYFGRDDDLIPDTENFDLDNLQQYLVKERLLKIPVNEETAFFNSEKLKGNLSASSFALLDEKSLNEELLPLRTTLEDYIHRESRSEIIEIVIDNLSLIGLVSGIFEKEIVQWRVGNLRDKDMIRAWILHLCFCALEFEQAYRYYYLNKGEVGVLSFERVGKEEAIHLLKMYLVNFIEAQQRLFITVSTDIERYLLGSKKDQKEKKEKTETEICAACQNALQKETKQAVYFERIFAQNNNTDYLAIHRQTEKWFAKMCEYKVK